MTEPEPSERSVWLIERFTDILTSAVERDFDHLQESLLAVAERYGDDGMYGICCALAETVYRLGFPGVEKGDGSLKGDLVIVEQLKGKVDPEDKPTLWACRFVASYINGDGASNIHLFFSSRDETDFLAKATVELIVMAADLARAKRDDLNAGQLPEG